MAQGRPAMLARRLAGRPHMRDGGDPLGIGDAASDYVLDESAISAASAEGLMQKGPARASLSALSFAHAFMTRRRGTARSSSFEDKPTGDETHLLHVISDLMGHRYWGRQYNVVESDAFQFGRIATFNPKLQRRPSCVKPFGVSRFSSSRSPWGRSVPPGQSPHCSPLAKLKMQFDKETRFTQADAGPDQFRAGRLHRHAAGQRQAAGRRRRHAGDSRRRAGRRDPVDARFAGLRTDAGSASLSSTR